ncbi:MAG TPA: proton-translocating transhydrogenase family protein, partial [Crocinitomicaceae bacterium]|nr:proton-translocating transhydrogenase family protein [Crocinitomicaceae bacterium]
VSRAMVTHDGKINWPPEPLPVSTQKPKAEVKVISEEEQRAIDTAKVKKKTRSLLTQLGIVGALLFLMGQFAPSEFMQHFTVFVLAVFVGWQVIWNVSHSLHTPLMAVTNAISGIIVVGGLLQVLNPESNWSQPLTIIAFLAILVASINIVGGFVVTHRMLKMFKK